MTPAFLCLITVLFLKIQREVANIITLPLLCGDSQTLPPFYTPFVTYSILNMCNFMKRKVKSTNVHYKCIRHVVIIYDNDENKPVAVHVCNSQDFPSAYSPPPPPPTKKKNRARVRPPPPKP